MVPYNILCIGSCRRHHPCAKYSLIWPQHIFSSHFQRCTLPQPCQNPILAPLVFGVIVIIHTLRNCSLMRAFAIERNDYTASCYDCPMIGKQN